MTRRTAARPAQGSDHGTPERRQHAASDAIVEETAEATVSGQVIATRRRFKTPIETIAASLSGPMLTAADRFRRDYEASVWRVLDRDRPVEPIVQRTRRTAEPTDLMIDAGRRVAAARQAMGEYTAPVVIGVVCDEMSLRELSASMCRNRQEMLGTLKAGLDIVARCYGIRAAA